MARLDKDIDLGIKRRAKVRSNLAPWKGGIRVIEGELAIVGRDGTVIDRKAGAVGAPVAHADKHGPEVQPQLWSQRRSLQKQADDPAHE